MNPSNMLSRRRHAHASLPRAAAFVSRIGLTVIISGFACNAHAAGKEIPQAIKTLLFEKSRFAYPITLDLPPAADRTRVEAYRQRAVNTVLMPPLELPGHVQPDDAWIRFLVSQGFVELDAVRKEDRISQATLYYPYHTAKARQYGGKDTLTVAKRVLAEITYTNLYKVNPMGMGERNAFGVTFTYAFRELIPRFPHVAKLFTGKARLQQDPTDGEWKFWSEQGTDLSLSDSAGREYLQVIEDLKSSAPAPIQQAGTPRIAPSPPAAASCRDTKERGYSMVLYGQDYTVKERQAPTGPSYILVGPTGAQVTQPEMLKALMPGVWTRENIVAAPDIRGGSRRVAAVLETSERLQRYGVVQDVVARAMVEAVSAAVTGGVSLDKGVPQLTWQIVRGNLANVRSVLTLVAQGGLRESVSAYTELEGMLPRVEGARLFLVNLEKAKNVYTRAKGLELPFAALATALMAKSGEELTDEALRSVVTEIMGELPNSDANVSLRELLNVQNSLMRASKNISALRAYRENYALAMRLDQANDNIIARLVKDAAVVCSQ